MGNRLNNKRVIVTGGASGIGEAIVKLFVTEGATVAVVDKDASDGSFKYKCDATDPEQSRLVFDKAVTDLGGLDCLVASVGASTGGSVLDTDVDLWDRTIAINLKSAFVWLQLSAIHMVSAGGGNIITLGSQLVSGGGKNNAAYITSKGAIHTLSRTAAFELAEKNIRVNCLVPGATDTPMLRRGQARHADPSSVRNASMARHALGRFATPDEIAAGALFLASDEASFVTGSELVIDGGWSVA